MLLGYHSKDLRIIYDNFQIDILNHAVEINENLTRQNSVFPPVAQLFEITLKNILSTDSNPFHFCLLVKMTKNRRLCERNSMRDVHFFLSLGFLLSIRICVFMESLFTSCGYHYWKHSGKSLDYKLNKLIHLASVCFNLWHETISCGVSKYFLDMLKNSI